MRNIVRPITDEIIQRAKTMGIRNDVEYLKNLLHTGNDYVYLEDGRRIVPTTPIRDANYHIKNNENHHMIKPDPDGCFYLKVTIKGKTVVKPLHKDAETARKMRDSHLEQLNFVPSRHSAR